LRRRRGDRDSRHRRQRPSPRRPTTSRSAAPTSATPTRGPPAPTGARATARPTARHSPMFPRFRGTTPAPASCSRATRVTSPSYGSVGFCNKSRPAKYDLPQTTASGSGGPAAARPAVRLGVRRRQRHLHRRYAKPSWQSLAPGNPSDGVRDLPDVSLFAANGLWGHYYPLCDSDTGDTKIPGHAPVRRAPGPAAAAPRSPRRSSPAMQALVESEVRGKTGQSRIRAITRLAASGVRDRRQQRLQLEQRARRFRSAACSTTSRSATWT
jgi:hypothetical protein